MIREIVSEILLNWNSAKTETFTNHPIAQLIRQNFKDCVANLISAEYPEFIVKASAGAGNWADVPWLSVLDPQISSTTQDGIYPVYLFCADGSGMYLSLNQGTSLPKEKYGKQAAQKRSLQISNLIKQEIPKLSDWSNDDVSLHAKTELGKSYELPNIAAKFYPAKNLPTEKEFIADLNDLMSFYKQIKPIWSRISTSGLAPKDLFEKKYAITKQSGKMIAIPKPFILLAGISGTGKTRFVREQARAIENYCLVPVRPDWHEPSDLLGYVSRIGGTHYVVPPLLQFIVSAWKNAFGTATASELINKPAVEMTPYWLCLDEMNLAPVEQYFADFLSVLETREWQGDTYTCQPILKAEIFNQFDEPQKIQLRKDLGIAENEFDDLWTYFSHVGIPLPPNLIVAGTVNMDETTHGFSRKVIDRAFTIDFGAFFPNDFDHYLDKSAPKPKTLGFPVLSCVTADDLVSVSADADGALTISFLKAINSTLKNTPFELAFRALNELLISVVCFNPKNLEELEAVWDDFLMTKVLPRIDGDGHKLTLSDDGKNSLLTDLGVIAAQQMRTIWLDGDTRPDLLRDTSDKIPCRSKVKLSWMQNRLSDNGFTSFWP